MITLQKAHSPSILFFITRDSKPNSNPNPHPNTFLSNECTMHGIKWITLDSWNHSVRFIFRSTRSFVRLLVCLFYQPSGICCSFCLSNLSDMTTTTSLTAKCKMLMMNTASLCQNGLINLLGEESHSMSSNGINFLPTAPYFWHLYSFSSMRKMWCNNVFRREN